MWVGVGYIGLMCIYIGLGGIYIGLGCIYIGLGCVYIGLRYRYTGRLCGHACSGLFLPRYGVATISRLLKIIGLFCRIQFLL